MCIFVYMKKWCMNICDRDSVMIEYMCRAIAVYLRIALACVCRIAGCDRYGFWLRDGWMGEREGEEGGEREGPDCPRCAQLQEPAAQPDAQHDAQPEPAATPIPPTPVGVAPATPPTPKAPAATTPNAPAATSSDSPSMQVMPYFVFFAMWDCVSMYISRLGKGGCVSMYILRIGTWGRIYIFIFSY